MTRRLPALVLTLAALASLTRADAPPSDLDARIEREAPSLEALYRDLHQHPELSYHEVATSARIARELRDAGYQVTEGFGAYADPALKSHGVVAVLRNGTGPTLLVRTELDALPIEERTGLPYASTARATNAVGQDVAVMHGCGHDVHMTAFVGVARLLASLRASWGGTLVLVGQPAEEMAPGGAEAMLKAGLYEKFPRPDFALSLHDDASLAAGKVGWVEGYACANVDAVDITIRGVGGHGAHPHTTRDPVVIAAQVVLQLQTIVSREVRPGEMAIVTVGSIHGGTKHNIIPDEVRLQITVRSYKDDVRRTVLAAIERITLGVAQAAGVPPERAPVVDLHPEKLVPAMYNDPELTRRVVGALRKSLGDGAVVPIAPVGGGEDFSHFGLTQPRVPCFQFSLGAVDPARLAEAARTGTTLPSLHSSEFAPATGPTLRTGVKAMVTAALELLSAK
jgi:hippurate hydrolase